LNSNIGIPSFLDSIPSGEKIDSIQRTFTLASTIPNQKEEENVEGPKTPVEEVAFDEENMELEPLDFNLERLDERTGVSVLFCGHCMHDDCFASFFASIVEQNHNNFFPVCLMTKNNFLQRTNVSKGEFFCPICRRLSNALIPIIAGNDEIFHEKSEEGLTPDFLSWVKITLPSMLEQESSSPVWKLPQLSATLKSTLQEVDMLAQRICCVQSGITISFAGINNLFVITDLTIFRIHSK
jgi:hypothetical protein